MGNDTSDIRHCWTSCQVCRECGYACCFIAGWGNEIMGIGGGGASWDDVRANRKGRGCARGTKSCYACCLDACPQEEF